MLLPCTWFPNQVFQPRRYRPGGIGNWSGHLPFAGDLVPALRPHCLVELGTHFGESYFGFCQAIAEHQIPCTAYAVDTWRGEAHAGFYDESVYADVQAYNQANYATFSYLVRKLFDEALEVFTDESIDLLHIDGMHTFEAVSHDFYAWLPKVKPGGVVLLHDICVKNLDFGVWKLWEELKAQGRTFEFHHSWGLGVFQKPGPDTVDSVLLEALFQGPTEVQDQLKRYYALAASELEVKHRWDAKPTSDSSLSVQIYPFGVGGYREEHSKTIVVEPDQWQRISVDIVEGISQGALRIDPVDRPAIIDLRGVEVTSAVDGSAIWSCSGAELAALQLVGPLVSLGSANTNGALCLLSYGRDPQIHFPVLPAGEFDQPLTLHLWVRVRADLDALLPLIEKAQKPPEPVAITEPSGALEVEKLAAEVEKLQTANAELNRANAELKVGNDELNRVNSELNSRNEELKTANGEQQKAHEEALNRAKEKVSELEALAASAAEAHARELETLVDQVNQRQTKLYLIEDAWRELQQEFKELEKKYIELESSYTELRDTYSFLEANHTEVQTAHRDLVRTYKQVLQSKSWRVTAPLRRITESTRR